MASFAGERRSTVERRQGTTNVSIMKKLQDIPQEMLFFFVLEVLQ